MPLITARRLPSVVHLSWSLADSGNLAISHYQILRGTAPGAETFLTTMAGTQVGEAPTVVDCTFASMADLTKVAKN